MQKVDQLLGPFICSILSVIEYFKNLFKEKDRVIQPRNILVMKFWGMGSIILIMPSVFQIKQSFSNCRIVFLTLKRNYEVLKAYSKIIDEIVFIDVDLGFKNFVLSFLNLLIYLIKTKFDIVIDYEFFTRFSSIVTFLTRSKIKAGFISWEVWRGNLHNVVVPFNRYWHVYDNFLNLTSKAINRKLYNIGLIEPEIIKKEEKTLLKNYICINPNCGELALQRRWPKENFVKLSKKILNDFKNLDIIFLGSLKEKEYVEKLVEEINHDNVKSYAGKLNFNELGYLIKGAKLLITNDSGPLHLAAALNITTISFFGPETPVLYGPLGEKHIIFFKNIDCSPCINVHKCKTIKCYKKFPNCLLEISVEEVYAEVKKILSNL